jgi:hypothetical protein
MSGPIAQMTPHKQRTTRSDTSQPNEIGRYVKPAFTPGFGLNVARDFFKSTSAKFRGAIAGPGGLVLCQTNLDDWKPWLTQSYRRSDAQDQNRVPILRNLGIKAACATTQYKGALAGISPPFRRPRAGVLCTLACLFSKQTSIKLVQYYKRNQLRSARSGSVTIFPEPRPGFRHCWSSSRPFTLCLPAVFLEQKRW